VKSLAALSVLALVICGSASAKVRMSISATDLTPDRGQRVALVVRSERALDFDPRLMAVAPGQPIFHVVATITGDTSHPDANVAQHGHEINLVRIGSTRWRGVTRFQRAGRWHVVVASGGPVGVDYPHGAALVTIVVR
jgi:hypothetical protein